MRRTWIAGATLMVMAGLMCHAAELPGSTPTIKICTAEHNLVSPMLLYEAKAYASRPFSRIGVTLEWLEAAECDASRVDAITISFVAGAPFGVGTDALAASFPYRVHGTSIVVYWDRVQRFIRPFGVRAGSVLGHVLAHEIGHMLEGFPQHSPTGLMKAKWTGEEISAMLRSGLDFEDHDRILIYTHIGRNLSRSQLASAGQEACATGALGCRELR